MAESTAVTCNICGRMRRGYPRWFLIVEDTWRDRLHILEWDERLAQAPSVARACCAEHVQELVVHWMTTGDVAYPFANSGRLWADNSRCDSVPAPPRLDISCARELGELAIDRESLPRMLQNNPDFLRVMLDALFEALEHPPGVRTNNAIDNDEDLVAVIPRAI